MGVTGDLMWQELKHQLFWATDASRVETSVFCWPGWAP